MTGILVPVSRLEFQLDPPVPGLKSILHTPWERDCQGKNGGANCYSLLSQSEVGFCNGPVLSTPKLCFQSLS